MHKITLLVLAIFMGASGWGQNTPVEPMQKTTDILRQEGRLFSVKIVRGQPLKIFVVGREEANLDLSKMKLVVRRLQPAPEKNLHLEKQGESFLVKDSLNVDSDIEVTTELKGTSEIFRFKVKAKP